MQVDSYVNVDSYKLLQTTPTMTSMPNPRRLLILSPTSQSPELIPPFLHSLTGSPVTEPPTPAATDRDRDPSGAAPATTFAGYTTHPPLRIQNKYYTAEIPIWVDEIGLSTDAGGDGQDPAHAGTEPGARTGSAAWKSEFLSQDAGVVRDAIGGIVLCVANPGHYSSSSLQSGTGRRAAGGPTESSDNDVLALKDLIRDIGQVKARIEEERDSIGDVVGLVVLAPRSPLPLNPTDTGRDTGDDIIDDLVGSDPGDEPFSTAWWEDQLSDLGILDFEIVAWHPRQENAGRNQFGGLSIYLRISLRQANYGRTPGYVPGTGGA